MAIQTISKVLFCAILPDYKLRIVATGEYNDYSDFVGSVSIKDSDRILGHFTNDGFEFESYLFNEDRLNLTISDVLTKHFQPYATAKAKAKAKADRDKLMLEKVSSQFHDYMTKGDTAKSGTAKSGTAKSGTAKSGTAKSGTAKSGTAKSGTDTLVNATIL